MKRFTPWLVSLLLISTLVSLSLNRSLHSRLTATQEQVTAAQTLRAEIDALKLELQTRKFQLDEMEMLRQQAADVHRLRGQAAQLPLLKAANENLRTQVEEQEQRVKLLRAELVQRTLSIDQLQRRLGEHHQRVKSLETELAQLALAPSSEPSSNPQATPPSLDPQALAHSDSIRYAAFSPDGRLILTSSQDGTARIWDVQTGQPLAPGSDSASQP